jgi:hypothetical protein
MFWFYLGKILRFLLVAPFFVLGFLFIPVQFQDRLFNSSPTWARCWVGFHDWENHPNPPDPFKWRKCSRCGEDDCITYP